MGSVEVEVGDEVVQGDVIGKSGQCEYDASQETMFTLKSLLTVNMSILNNYMKATNTITIKNLYQLHDKDF